MNTIISHAQVDLRADTLVRSCTYVDSEMTIPVT